MGYEMRQRGSQFLLYAENKPAALRALQKMLEGGHQYRWVENRAIAHAIYLEEALDEWGWEAKHSETAGINGLEFQREKAGDEDALFAALAPFVEPGSYIEMQGEEGELWRWVFDGASVQRIEARTSWPELPKPPKPPLRFSVVVTTRCHYDRGYVIAAASAEEAKEKALSMARGHQVDLRQELPRLSIDAVEVATWKTVS